MVSGQPLVVGAAEEASSIVTKIAVVGANGMLGRDMLKVLGSLDPAPFARKDLDITDENASRLMLSKFDVVINCAGYTKVDEAETNRAIAFAVNEEGPRNLARAMAKTGGKLIHISTDYVFDGEATKPYAEDFKPNPSSVYGASKLAGEIAVHEEHGSGATILRTSWLYGRHGESFPRTILEAGTQREFLDVVDDQVGQPTWTVDVAQQVKKLIHAGLPSGVFHATNAGQVTWFEFARALFCHAGWDESRIRRTTSASFSRPATRPHYSVLGHKNWSSHGMTEMRGWESALSEAWDQFLGRYSQQSWTA